MEDEIKNLNSLCFYLIHKCLETGAEGMVITQNKVVVKGEDIGNWEIKVSKID